MRNGPHRRRARCASTISAPSGTEHDRRDVGGPADRVRDGVRRPGPPFSPNQSTQARKTPSATQPEPDQLGVVVRLACPARFAAGARRGFGARRCASSAPSGRFAARAPSRRHGLRRRRRSVATGPAAVGVATLEPSAGGVRCAPARLGRRTVELSGVSRARRCARCSSAHEGVARRCRRRRGAFGSAAVVAAAPVDVRAARGPAPSRSRPRCAPGATSTRPGRITCATATGSWIGEPPRSR